MIGSNVPPLGSRLLPLLLAGSLLPAAVATAAEDAGVDSALDGDAIVEDAGSDSAVDGGVEPDPFYVPSTTNVTGTRLRWMRSNCVRLRPNSAGSKDIDDGSDLEAVTSSVQRWHDTTDPCSYLRVDLLEASPDAEQDFDREGLNENVLVWVESDWPHDRAAAGITTVFFVDADDSADDGRILDADIELNGEHFSFGTSGRRGLTDVENTVVHELGHLMGLDHTCDDLQRTPTPLDNNGDPIPRCVPLDDLPPDVTEATMYNFAVPGETKKRTPESGDIAGVCEAYPTAADPGRCESVDLSGGGGCGVAPSPPPATRGAPIGVTVALLGLLLCGTWVWRRRRLG